MLSIQLSSRELFLSAISVTMNDLRLRWIIKAAFITMRVSQVLRADRPSKLRRWRCAEQKAFWTASSASSVFRRMAYATAMNLARDATNISSNAFLPSVSACVFTEPLARTLVLPLETDRTFLFGALKTGRALLNSGALARPLTVAVCDA